MEKATNFMLCGGTFFTLLLEARQARTGKKEQLHGKRDGLSEPETLAGLVRVMYPEFKEPSGESTFKTNTTDYKTCRNNGGNFPFFDKEIKAFDNRVKSNYKAALLLMCKFVNQFIEVGGSLKRDEWLVKALLDLIDKDQSIQDTDVFYMCKSGQTVTKASLRSATTVCLPAFLLGVWHFIVVNRRDNTVGKDTIEKWCPPNNRNPRVYIGSMGESITRTITVSMPIISDSMVDSDEIVDDEPFVEAADLPDENETYPAPSEPSNQTINNHAFIFQQFGKNNTQIAGNINTLLTPIKG